MRPYIVMELIRGQTLRDMVHEDGALYPQRAMHIVADLCNALEYSHQMGVIHRDVKPGNIMITNTGKVKVMDFGIARVMDAPSTMTTTSQVIGTASYLSPEQARGQNVDVRSDIYAAGCVLSTRRSRGSLPSRVILRFPWPTSMCRKTLFRRAT